MGNIVPILDRLDTLSQRERAATPPALSMPPPRTAGELRFDPLPVPRRVMKENGCFYVCDGFYVDFRGRRLFARLWQAPTSAAIADLSPIDGLGPL